MYRIDGVPSSLRFLTMTAALIVAQSEISSMVRERETKNAVATPPLKERWQTEILKLKGKLVSAAEVDKPKILDEIKQLELELQERISLRWAAFFTREARAATEKEIGNAGSITVTSRGVEYELEIMDSSHAKMKQVGTDRWGTPLHVAQLDSEIMGQLKAKGLVSGNFLKENANIGDDKLLLERNVAEEAAAINLYEGQKKETRPHISDLLEHVIQDEREHIMEFSEQLKDLDTPIENVVKLKIGDKVRFKDIMEDEDAGILIPAGTEVIISKDIGGGLFRGKTADGKDVGAIVYPEDVELVNTENIPSEGRLKPNAASLKVGDPVRAIHGLLDGHVVGILEGGVQVKWESGEVTTETLAAVEKLNADDPAVKDRDVPEIKQSVDLTTKDPQVLPAKDDARVK
jgi:hypothetical protein